MHPDVGWSFHPSLLYINPTQQGGRILIHIYCEYVASLNTPYHNCQKSITPVPTGASYTLDILHHCLQKAFCPWSNTWLNRAARVSHFSQKLRNLEQITQKCLISSPVNRRKPTNYSIISHGLSLDGPLCSPLSSASISAIQLNRDVTGGGTENTCRLFYLWDWNTATGRF